MTDAELGLRPRSRPCSRTRSSRSAGTGPGSARSSPRAGSCSTRPPGTSRSRRPTSSCGPRLGRGSRSSRRRTWRPSPSSSPAPRQAAATADTAGRPRGELRRGGPGRRQRRRGAPERGRGCRGRWSRGVESPFDPTPTLLDVESSLAEGEESPPPRRSPVPTDAAERARLAGPGRDDRARERAAGDDAADARGGAARRGGELAQHDRPAARRGGGGAARARGVLQRAGAPLPGAPRPPRGQHPGQAPEDGEPRPGGGRRAPLPLPVARGLRLHTARPKQSLPSPSPTRSSPPSRTLERRRLEPRSSRTSTPTPTGSPTAGTMGAPRLLQRRGGVDPHPARVPGRRGRRERGRAAGPGQAVMLAGYLSDRLDRWGDELVPPAEAPSGGPGGRGRHQRREPPARAHPGGPADHRGERWSCGTRPARPSRRGRPSARPGTVERSTELSEVSKDGLADRLDALS